MARKMVKWMFRNGSGNQTRAQNRFALLRDRFRDLEATMDIKVSDICLATLPSGSGDPELFMFVIQAGDTEFLFTHFNNSSNIGIANNALSDVWGANWEDFVGGPFHNSTTDYSSTTRVTMMIHYNNKKGFFAMGFDDAINLTYTGGDYSSGPEHNPQSATANFFPFEAGKGITPIIFSTSSWGYEDDPEMFSIVIDDTPGDEFISVVLNNSISVRLHSVQILGDILDNEEALDVETGGRFSSGFTVTTTSRIPFFTSNQLRLSALDGDGNRHIFDQPSYNRTWTAGNTPNSSGEYPWGPMYFSSTSYSKGWIKSSIVRSVGAPSARDFNLILDGPSGPMIKLEEYTALPWAEGEPGWPAATMTIAEILEEKALEAP